MDDCCIRVTALLEYFEWTSTTQHVRGHDFSMSILLVLLIPRGGGRFLVLSRGNDKGAWPL